MKAQDIFENKNAVKFALIAAGTIAVIYAINNAGAEVAGGIASGAELTGGGLGIAAIIGVSILLL